MTRKPRIASRNVTHKPPHACPRLPSLALRVTSLRRLASASKAFPLAGDRLFMTLRSLCAASLVDRLAGAKVSESWRADMARWPSLRIRIMQRCACGLYRVRSTRRGGRDRPPAWRALSDVTGYYRTTARPGATRRPAPGTPALGGRGDLYGAGDGVAGYGDRQHRAARHCRRSPCQPGRRGLGGQHLSDRAGCDAAAARRARRNRRPSADLCRRPVAVHAGLARLRVRMVAAEPDGGTLAAGAGRQRHHERECGAGPLRLSDPYAGPRLWPQRAGCRNGVHVRADDCLRDPCDRNMAMAV